MASLHPTSSTHQVSSDSRFDGKPGKVKVHMIELHAQLVGITGPTPNQNGRSIGQGHTIPATDGNPAENIPLWTFPNLASPKPIQQQGETLSHYKTTCDLWKHDNADIQEERINWKQTNKDAINIIRSLMSNAAL